MIAITETTTFRKDIKRTKKRGKDLTKLLCIIKNLSENKTLDAKYKPHPLTGKWKSKWECHIEPDWLLIYELNKNELKLIRTGTHADLFKM